jgi:hypothetical protein
MPGCCRVDPHDFCVLRLTVSATVFSSSGRNCQRASVPRALELGDLEPRSQLDRATKEESAVVVRGSSRAAANR